MHNNYLLLLKLLVNGCCLVVGQTCQAQVSSGSGSDSHSDSVAGVAAAAVGIEVKGHVFDTHIHKNPVAYIKIQSSSGEKTFTDQQGFYRIRLRKGDTVRIYNTTNVLVVTYPAAYMLFYAEFNVYLLDPEFMSASGDRGHDLATVKVTVRDYQKDSMELRRLYGDIFDYQRPKLKDAIEISKIGKVPVPLAVGINIPELVGWLQAKKNNQKDRWKGFAHFAEDERYLQHRLSAATIEAFTGLRDEDSIHYLQMYYRPLPKQLRDMNELELGEYLIKQVHALRSGALPAGAPAFPMFKSAWTDSIAIQSFQDSGRQESLFK